MLLTMTWSMMRNVPGGIQTVPPGPAAAMAWFIALVELLTPVGSAPNWVMETDPAGWGSAAATFSKSAKSMV